MLIKTVCDGADEQEVRLKIDKNKQFQWPEKKK
jgi:hypothetical protein